jgi:hypothetical protein
MGGEMKEEQRSASSRSQLDSDLPGSDSAVERGSPIPSWVLKWG